MVLDGPAAGDARLKTKAPIPTGRSVIGTVNNCAGGITAWNTYLMAEENFRFYFWADEPAEGKEVCAGKETESAKRYGLGETKQAWGKFTDNPNLRRFNLDAEPNEPNRFGWIVEVDPLDPQARRRSSTPRSAASATRGRKASSTRMGASCSIRATIRASSTSTSSSPRTPSIRTTARPTNSCCRKARSMSPSLLPTAAWRGCRSSSAKARSPRTTALTTKPTS